jgi:hypothetical protein
MKTTMFYYSPRVFWTWYNTNDYNTCRTKIIYPKMPNKGLRKMQAKPLLNITKQFKTKS